MTLQLWPKQVPVQAFEGRNIDQMPMLLNTGMEPMSVAQLMQWRLWALDQPDEIKSAWWDNYVDCGATGAVRDSSKASGNFKINHSSATLRGIYPKSKLANGGLILTPEQYAALEGNEYTSEQVTRFTGFWFVSVEAVVANPIWQDLADGDMHLLKEYATAVFAEGKQRFVGYNSAMRLLVPDAQEQVIERPWCVGRSDIDERLGADGGSSDLDSYIGRLVGVAPGALRARARGDTERRVMLSLDQILAIGREHVSPAGQEALTEAINALCTFRSAITPLYKK